MAKLRQIDPGNASVVHDFAAADQQVAQMDRTGCSNGAEQRIVQSKIAGMAKLEDRNVRQLPRRENARILEPEHARTAGAAGQRLYT